MIRHSMLAVLFLSAVLIISCSGNSTMPTLPDMTTPGITSGHETHAHDGSSKAVWGVWEVGIDTTTWEVSMTPIRGVQFTVDVVTFLQPPVGNITNLSIMVTDVTDWFTLGLIGVDVGLRHPFPGLDQYTGFDVYGVFVAPGSVGGQYDGDVIYTNGDDEPILLNADGYTRWMNPVEFPDTGTILDFTPGLLGDQDIGLFTSTINAFKYFADGLEKDEDVGEFFADPLNTDERGTFRPGGFNEREYDLKFPMVDDSPYLVFQYAVVASWIEPDTTLSGDPDALDVPGDFALSANADEAIYLDVTDNSTLYYADSIGGGDINLDLEVYDWGALQSSANVADEIFQIVVEGDSSVISGGYVAFDQTTLAATATPGSSVISSIFQIDIANCTPLSNDDFPILITVESFAPDTFDPGTGTPMNADSLAAYFFTDVEVGTEVPWGLEVTSPNGGETLWMAMSHEITWDPGPGGITDVNIEWSTDNFVSDIREIVASTENDGSYIWAPIPVEDTTIARIIISDVLGTDSDTSDGDFTIALPVWLDIQDPMYVDEANVSWSSWPYTYNDMPDEISPAISQDNDGTVHIGFYGVNYGSTSYDRHLLSSNGTYWQGNAGYWNTGGANDRRHDYCKIAPSHHGHSWCCTSHNGQGYYSDIDRWMGGNGYYCFDGPDFSWSTPKYPEIATDNAGYIFLFGNSGTAGIRLRKTNQPGFICGGCSGQLGPTVVLTDDGNISKTRSWARQGQGVAFIYYTVGGNVILAETTDAPTNDTWDTSEIIWSIGSDYTACHTPAICADVGERLFAAWVAQETAGDWCILASMREIVDGPWSDPAIVTLSSDEFKDVHISSAEVLLPSGTTEDVAVVSWEKNNIISSALSPLDMMAFLPLQDISDTAITAQSPDGFCVSDNWGYTYDVLFAYSWDDGNWDIAINHADFDTP